MSVPLLRAQRHHCEKPPGATLSHCAAASSLHRGRLANDHQLRPSTACGFTTVSSAPPPRPSMAPKSPLATTGIASHRRSSLLEPPPPWTTPHGEHSSSPTPRGEPPPCCCPLTATPPALATGKPVTAGLPPLSHHGRLPCFTHGLPVNGVMAQLLGLGCS
jgi:hypothetical protein